MNFDFSEEQVMLRDSVARFIQDDYSFDARRRIAASDTGMSQEHWKTFAGLGWLSVPFAEEHGGFGGGPVDIMVMMEEFGKGLVLEPYFATVILFGGLLQHAGNAEQQAAHIPQIIEGNRLGAFAFAERQSRYELADVRTVAIADGDGFLLSGEKVVVYNGPNADTLIVAARTSGEQCEENGISLFLVDAAAEGIEKLHYPLMDGHRASNIVFRDVRLSGDALLGDCDGAFPVISRVVLESCVALAAEGLGIMGQLNTKTLEYTKQREQFGVAIGSFQALQHRMVDTFMSYEQTKSLLYRAVCTLEKTGENPLRDIHALKVMLDRAGRHVHSEAIQLHGGMGLTDEMDIAHYAKRLMLINATFGDGDYHQARFNALNFA